MALDPLETFENGIARSLYLVSLYELILNNRKRGVRRDWAESFKKLMHWRKSDDLVLSGSSNCILVIRNPNKWKMKDFNHETLSELLRSAYVSAVSAMDRYFHDIILNNVLSLLSRKSDEIPKGLSNFVIPLGDVEAAIKHVIRSRRSEHKAARPRTKIKQCFSEALHRKTFQKPNEIDEAFKMLGIRNIWSSICGELETVNDANEARKKLNQIVKRRNQIVHEGDVRRSERARETKTNQIWPRETRNEIEWISELIRAADKVVKGTL